MAPQEESISILGKPRKKRWNEDVERKHAFDAYNKVTINKLHSYSTIVSKWSPSLIKATQLCFTIFTRIDQFGFEKRVVNFTVFQHSWGNPPTEGSQTTRESMYLIGDD